MVDSWDDIEKITNLAVEHLTLKAEILDLAKEYHKTKSIPVATELANKVYRLMILDGVINEKS